MLFPTLRRLLALAILIAAPAAATPPTTPSAELLGLREVDRRLETIAFRLATANVALCPRQSPWSGMLLHDAGEYEPNWRAAATASFALDGNRPAILAVAPASPAVTAGLAEDATVLSINSAPLPAPPLPRAASTQGTDDAQAALTAALGAGPVRLGLGAGPAGAQSTVILTAIPGCASQVRLMPGAGLAASADGSAVEVSGGLEEFANDNELAVVIGHEMAHNILGHRARLDAEHVNRGLFASLGANAARIRATEEEADYLGLYLAARAGYDIGAAEAFWPRYARATGGIFGDATHPDWRHRQAMVAATLREIAALRAAGKPLIPQATRFAATSAPRTGANN